jgi:hypothetical protein
LKFTLNAFAHADVAEKDRQTAASGIHVPLKPVARRSRGGPFKMNRKPVMHCPAIVLVKFWNDARWRQLPECLPDHLLSAHPEIGSGALIGV